jgi:hypothetical protein
MPRRFTITEKWDKPWFMQLSPYAKLLFLYLADRCDLAGIWEINTLMASLQTGLTSSQVEKAENELLTEYAGERKVIRGQDHLWLVQFVRHQRNLPLNPENRAHTGIITSLAEHSATFGFDLRKSLETNELPRGLEGAWKPLPRGSSTSKGKGTLLLEDKSLREETKIRHLEFVLLTAQEYEKLCTQFGKEGADDRIRVLNEGIGSKGYRYKSHYYTILSWDRLERKRNAAPIEETTEEIQARLHAKGLL